MGFIRASIVTVLVVSSVLCAEPPTPRQAMAQLLGGYRLTQLVYVAAKLDIAGHLKDGPLSAAELARKAGANPDALYRVLRALAGLGLFTEEPAKRFRLAPMGELLLPDAAGSVRADALVAGEDFMWRSWGNLLHSTRTGETAFNHVFGEQTFEWFKEHPAEARLFDEFQAEITRASSESVLRAYDFSTANTVVDVGGGNGQLLSSILDRYPSISAVLFDLKHVAAAARAKPLPLLESRCEFVGGDFFQSIPVSGDLFVLKYILHDWDDERAGTILRNVQKAMPDRARLLVIEDLICGLSQPCRAKVSDVTMLVRTGGRNRTEAEYRKLLGDAGFEVTRVLPTGGDLAILECVRGR